MLSAQLVRKYCVGLVDCSLIELVNVQGLMSLISPLCLVRCTPATEDGGVTQVTAIVVGRTAHADGPLVMKGRSFVAEILRGACPPHVHRVPCPTCSSHELSLCCAHVSAFLAHDGKGALTSL